MISNKKEERNTVTTTSRATSDAEERIRTMALQNQKTIYPISMGVTPPTLAMQVAHPNIALAAQPHVKKAAAKRSPKNSPRRNKAVIANANARASGNPAPLPPAVDVPRITSTFNNFDYTAVTKGSTSEMSLQQRKILQLLESGFKGSVEDVIRAVQ